MLPPRPTTAEAVVRHFRDHIARGRLRPGQALPGERRLQAELGVSRVALREGLAQLGALGLVRSAQGRPTVVADEVDLARLGDGFLPLAARDGAAWSRDLLECRRLLEVAGAGLAAERVAAAQGSIPAVAELPALAQALVEALGSATRYRALDESFHHAIVAASGNAMLAHLHRLLQLQLAPLIAHSVARAGDRAASAQAHARILAAIQAGDGDAARAAMAAHLDACASAAHRQTKGADHG